MRSDKRRDIICYSMLSWWYVMINYHMFNFYLFLIPFIWYMYIPYLSDWKVSCRNFIWERFWWWLESIVALVHVKCQWWKQFVELRQLSITILLLFVTQFLSVTKWTSLIYQNTHTTPIHWETQVALLHCTASFVTSCSPYPTKCWVRIQMKMLFYWVWSMSYQYSLIISFM